MVGPGTQRARRGAALLAVIATCGVSHAPAQETGLYSAAQAERGGQLYQQSCAACHGSQLQGSPSVPLTGDSFRARWEDGKHTLDDLYYIIRSLMPNDAPGSLTRAQYADIVAYILQVNRYPSGETELVPKAAEMKAVVLQPH
jgi:S-disulfanyl-L-cysteine oxidoreductase SoxD